MLLDTLKQFYHFDSSTILPFGVFGLPPTRDSYIRFITHYVQNALTSPYCSQNYTAIHLFFHYLCFWTRQNDCIPLTAMHSFCCVKPSTNSRRTSTSALPATTYWMHQQHPTTARTALIFIYSFNINAFGHITTILSLRQRYHTSFCCVKPSTHAGLTLRFITHNVQNALTSSYCSQNYTAIHLFFCN
jgi:hypothetical protein